MQPISHKTLRTLTRGVVVLVWSLTQLATAQPVLAQCAVQPGCQGCVSSAVGSGCSCCDSGWSCGLCDSDAIPCQPVVPESSGDPMAPIVTSPSLTDPTPAASAPNLAFSEQSAAFGGRRVSMPSTVGGYIDDAFIRTRVRFRYDNAANIAGVRDIDRAEYLYPHLATVGGRGPDIFGGSTALLTNLDMEEFRTYIEYAFTPNFSAFVDLPVRQVKAVGVNGPPFVDPGTGARQDVSGFGDLNAGVRLGLINCPDRKLTGQIRVYAPTGEAREGLGVGHSSLELGLLYQEQVTDSWTVFGEVQDWINLDPFVFGNAAGFNGTVPFTGEEATSNVLRYGVGTGYDLWRDCRCSDHRLMAVAEVVGWTTLDGFASDAQNVLDDVAGDTIINGKYGLRYNRGPHTLYVGYGHAWRGVGKRWYRDIVRIEFGRNF